MASGWNLRPLGSREDAHAGSIAHRLQHRPDTGERARSPDDLPHFPRAPSSRAGHQRVAGTPFHFNAPDAPRRLCRSAEAQATADGMQPGALRWDTRSVDDPTTGGARWGDCQTGPREARPETGPRTHARARGTTGRLPDLPPTRCYSTAKTRGQSGRWGCNGLVLQTLYRGPMHRSASALHRCRQLLRYQSGVSGRGPATGATRSPSRIGMGSGPVASVNWSGRSQSSGDRGGRQTVWPAASAQQTTFERLIPSCIDPPRPA